jgi:hypothetical protein
MADAATTWQPQDLDTDEDEIRQAALPEQIAAATAQRIAVWHLTELEQETKTLEAHVVRTICACFCDGGNLRLRSWALAFAADMELTRGMSETEIAEKFNVTRAALSKEVTRWRRTLQLHTHRNSRSPQARHADQQRATAVHSRSVNRN